MSDFYWHIDEAFFSLISRPLLFLGTAFAVMLAITIAIVIRSKGDSDDA